MNRKSIVILVAGAMAMLSGCLMFYTGSEEGPFGVVAERDEPGRPKEVILQAGGRANWYVVFGPDGGGKDTYFRATRYYIASGGKTNSLSHATKWAYDDTAIEGAIPVRGTDRWVLAYCTKMTGDFVSLDVRVFTAEKLIARYEIEEVVRDAEKDDLSGYGVCVVSDDGRSITFPTAGGDCVLDGATGKLSRPAPLPDLEEGVRIVKKPKGGGISLYDCAADRFAWTIPDQKIQAADHSVDRRGHVCLFLHGGDQHRRLSGRLRYLANVFFFPEQPERDPFAADLLRRRTVYGNGRHRDHDGHRGFGDPDRHYRRVPRDDEDPFHDGGDGICRRSCGREFVARQKFACGHLLSFGFIGIGLFR